MQASLSANTATCISPQTSAYQLLMLSVSSSSFKFNCYQQKHTSPDKHAFLHQSKDRSAPVIKVTLISKIISNQNQHSAICTNFPMQQNSMDVIFSLTLNLIQCKTRAKSSARCKTRVRHSRHTTRYYLVAIKYSKEY